VPRCHAASRCLLSALGDETDEVARRFTAILILDGEIPLAHR
jgi:hypothetical protein